MNKIKYYVYNKINYINRNYYKKRKFKNKNTNNKIKDLKDFERIRKLKNRLKNLNYLKKKDVNKLIVL